MKKNILTLVLAVVSSLWMMSEAHLNSLCDEWNVLVTNISHGPRFVSFSTLHYRLTTDTIINRTRYVCLEQSGEHIGAMREGDNRDIYYIPAGGTHEYLLYAFNAQTGDTLYNMWVSERLDRYNGKRATIREIQDTDPRTFVVKYEFTYNNDKDTSWLSYDWIEGVGMSYGPSGDKCPFDCAGDFGEYVLCAYKNNQQVYVSEWGEKYGCEYNYDPSQPTDTIQLYARDDSGSSTVDPVDPNQIYATLTGNVLTVHNNTGAQVTFTLNNTSVNNVAARVRKNGQPTTFTESISVELSEDGIYEILLTSEEWNYSIFGTINYVRSATTITKEDPALTTKKVLRGTQILIERGDKTYTLTGQEIN